MKSLIDKLETKNNLTKDEWITLFNNTSPDLNYYAAKKALKVKQKIYGDDIYIRGLIEFTNYCSNDCYYCGIRCHNKNAIRYRLSKKDILDCCKNGYDLGFRTFVMQGGEDKYYTQEMLEEIISSIKEKYSDCALTLSIGERSFESYKGLKDAGADRFLLRHETADKEHYKKLHPYRQTFKNRINCLKDLKKLGYTVGSGFMVGAPFETADTFAENMLFLNELQPEMVGIGPFIPHKDTDFKNYKSGTLEDTLFILSLIRLMMPEVLLPATTALKTIHPDGHKLGILAGANVIMPNLSPVKVRNKYSLYDNKACTGSEAAEYLFELKKEVESIGSKIVVSRGDKIRRIN